MALDAEDQSEITAIAGGAAVSLSQSQRDEIQGDIAAAIALNSINSNALAQIDPTAVESAGNVEVNAISNPTIFVLALGISTTFATGGSSSGGVSFDGAGSVAYNTITDFAQAIVDASNVTAGGDVLVTASDTSKITAISGAGSVSISTSSGAAVGVAISINEGHDTARAAIRNGATVNATGKVTVSASSTSNIKAWSVAGAGSVSSGAGSSGVIKFAGAGAVTFNSIGNLVEALIDASSVTAGPGQAILVQATDSSHIEAIAGALAFALSISNSTGLAISIAAAFARNDIGNTLNAKSTNSTLTTSAAGPITLDAQSSASIFALTIGVAGAISAGSGGGASFAGAGSGSGNGISNHTKAQISGGTAISGGALSVTATDNATINADAGGVSIVFTRGPPGLAFGVSVASDDIHDAADARISGAATVTAPSVLVKALSTTKIDSVTIAGGGAVATGTSTGFVLAGAGAISLNSIGNTVTAKIEGTGTTVTSTGFVNVIATDDATIHAFAGALAITLSLTSSGGAAVSIGVSVGNNEIADDVSAAIDHATVTAGSVTVSASTTAEIDVLAFGISGSLTAGNSFGLSLAAAGSISINDIASATTARITASTINTAGAVNVTATDSSEIDTDAGGVAAVITLGGSPTASLSAAASVAINGIANTVNAVIEDSDIGSSPAHVASVLVEAKFTGTIDSMAFVGVTALNVSSSFGAAATIAGSVTVNQITNTIAALIVDGSNVFANGNVSVKASDSSTIKADSAAAAATVSASSAASFGASLTGAVALNTIGNVVTAAIDGSTVETGGEVLVEARNTSVIDTLSLSLNGSVAAGSSVGILLGGAVSYSKNGVANTTRARIGGSTIADASVVNVSAADGTFITATAGAVSIGIGGGSGAGAGIAMASRWPRTASPTPRSTASSTTRSRKR